MMRSLLRCPWRRLGSRSLLMGLGPLEDDDILDPFEEIGVAKPLEEDVTDPSKEIGVAKPLAVLIYPFYSNSKHVFHPPGPKVDWSSLLVGSLKISRHRFILWLAILGRLSTLDKLWLKHLGTDCVLCRAATPETHNHLFFSCSFASECLHEIRDVVSFHWPYSNWETAIRWASARWREKHVVNASYRALLARLFIIFGMKGIAEFSADCADPCGYC
ncbi:UNVERIFIED_CONTAM: hypothetical protein Slati_0887100 [Sesamum latifolium]|uniref:Reverse transcriptase zinc-binding domain-containing protein n=1 Tax=Sesamum latifolium TaxID=2727402 RepID=A0AAW2XMV4_9LAMI